MLLCCVNISFAQTQNSGFRNYRLLSVDDGLPSNHITCFAKDSEGFMWIGTTGGLVRYDGSELVVYQNDETDSTTISGNFVVSIAMEGDSIMWVGTADKGLSKYRFKTQKFQRYFPKPEVSGSLPYEEVYTLQHDAFGNLWVGFHRGGLCKYNKEKDTFKAIELPEFIDSRDSRQSRIIKKIIFDKNEKHIIWIITIYHLFRYNDLNKTFNVYTYSDPKSTGQYNVVGLGYGITGLDGKIYIPSNKRGVIVFDPKTEEWENYNDIVFNPLNIRQNSYRTIEQRDSTSFWVGSRTRGLAILDLNKGNILPIDSCSDNKEDQLCKLYITCMDMDTPEGHWIGTNKGLRLYNKIGNQFNVYKHTVTKKDLKNRESVVSICQNDKDGFYYGGYAGEGIYYYNFKNKTKSLINPPKKFKPGVLYEMFFTRSILPYNDSTLLVLSSNAFFKLHTKTKRMEEIKTGLTYTKDYFYFHRIFKHSDGTYYISTRYNGIYRLNPSFQLKDHLFHDPNDSNSLVSSHYIYEICEDPNGNVWIGTEDGFSVFNPLTFSFTNSDYKLRLDSVSQLKIIYSIKLAPDSSLWFIDARENGVSIEYPYKKPYIFKPIITGKNSLSERLANILFTQDGKIILPTINGLSIINQNDEIERYNDKQGLPVLRTIGPILELSDGRIAIGSNRNIIIFHPDSLYGVPNNLPIYISSISIFNEKHDVNMTDIMKDGLVLTHLQNYFSINLSMINYDNPEEYTLSYRLRGLSDEWITDKEKKAVFTNVPGGNYVFEAKFLDRNNQVLEQSLLMPVEIIPPFWKTWWFKILAFGVFVLIGLAFYLIRISNIKREAALKTEFNKQLANMELSTLRAQMNPHFLFNSLNSIRNKIISNKTAEADKYLVKFSRLVRQVLHNSTQKLINLKDEIDTLGLYVDLESSRFDHRFEYDLSVSEGLNLQDFKIPPLILQPYVENAIWHGLMQKEEAGRVSIAVSIENDSLHIVIEDDGVGRAKARELQSKTAANRQSMGMGITGNRLEIIENLYQLKCTAEITDLKNQNGEALGTRITLTLPLIYES